MSEEPIVTEVKMNWAAYQNIVKDILDKQRQIDVLRRQLAMALEWIDSQKEEWGNSIAWKSIDALEEEIAAIGGKTADELFAELGGEK
jgi:DNA-binding protein H-NS